MKEEWLTQATENDLKQLLVKRLASDFKIFPEVEGNFPVDNAKVIIDYLFYPKPQLINRGFIQEWFGIEVKALGNIDDRVKKGIGAAWQSITYSQSAFRIADETIRPAFVLMFPPFDAFLIGREGDSRSDAYLRSLLQRANVGFLYLEKDDWEIRFAYQRLFSFKKGPGNVKNVGLNRYVGNVEKKR